MLNLLPRHLPAASRLPGPLGLVVALTLTLTTPPMLLNAEWAQFRGPGGSGSTEAKGVPLSWSENTNMAWKTPLPGPGASSPIVIGNRIFLTCFTGYAVSSREPGDMSQLKRHLLCVDATDGKILWNTATPAELPEQERIREDHGYASSTPAADAERIYAFYGKSGLLAFDHTGKQLWQAKVGDQLNGWGSATSPVLYRDWVIVNASVESESVVAIDKRNGKEIWRARGIKESWHAPLVVSLPDGKTELVLAMLKKVVGLNPDTGEPLWKADTGINWYMCPTPLAVDGIIYSIGGRNPNGGLAIRGGGRGDVTGSHVLWKVNKGSNVPSPLLYHGYLFFAHENLGVVYCVDARSGELLYEERLEPSPGQIYASPVLAEGRIYYTGRGGRTVTIAAQPQFKFLAESRLEGGRGMFNASPAFHGSRMLLRSDRALYCLGK